MFSVYVLVQFHSYLCHQFKHWKHHYNAHLPQWHIDELLA